MKDFRISLSNNNIVIITVRSKDLSLAVLVKKTKDIMIKQNKRWRRLTGEWKLWRLLKGWNFIQAWGERLSEKFCLIKMILIV